MCRRSRWMCQSTSPRDLQSWMPCVQSTAVRLGTRMFTATIHTCSYRIQRRNFESWAARSCKLDSEYSVPLRPDAIAARWIGAAAMDTRRRGLRGAERETKHRIEALIAADHPFTLAYYPKAEHGMTLFDVNADGDRISTGYAPGYFELIRDFARDGQVTGELTAMQELTKRHTRNRHRTDRRLCVAYPIDVNSCATMRLTTHYRQDARAATFFDEARCWRLLSFGPCAI